MSAPLICVVYDGIYHSIFEGQVLSPTLKKIDAGLHTTAHIVSFEETLSPQLLAARDRFSRDPRITISLIKRPRFLAPFLLLQQAWQLRRILKKIPAGYTVSARGPLAGYIAKKALTSDCKTLIIQARGLLAQEYAYTHRHATGLRALAHAARWAQYWNIEEACYAPGAFQIEAVSPALQNYLVQTYAADPTQFSAPLFDTPDPLPEKARLLYRSHIREQLGIAPHASVYIYNGSLKPWQCPEQTIAVFQEAYAKDARSFFLALTQDTVQMSALLCSTTLPRHAYKVMQVAQHEILQYLCAGDFGLLFREENPLNWVSRPTKLLEYEAVGLKVLHNNTIAWLTEKTDLQ